MTEYAKNKEGNVFIAEFVEKIKRVEKEAGLKKYVTRLNPSYLNGELPIMTVVQEPKGLTPVRLDLYWNPNAKMLELDWDDSNPYSYAIRRNL